MRGNFASWLLLGSVSLLGSFELGAQLDRYELGRRVRQFERVFATAAPASRAAATVAPLKSAVTSFFSLQLGAAGAHLMAAQRALQPREGDVQRWADSLFIHPARRAIDIKAEELGFRVRAFYELEGEVPADAKVVLELWAPAAAKDSTSGAREAGQSVARVSVALTELPLDGSLPLESKTLAPGDGWRLRAHLVVGDVAVPIAETPISLVKNLTARLARIKKAAGTADTKTTRGATLRAHYRFVRALSSKRTLETDYPVAALLAQAERDLETAKGGKPLRRGPGQHWLTLAAGTRRIPVRIGIPAAALKADKPVPLVLALHGAGGSENMFFDGYGDGEVWRLARSRGWIVCATRQGLGGAPLPEVVTALSAVVPVRRDRVFMVGHSMGAGQAVAAACKDPGTFRAVAALGGGGRVRPNDGLKALPFLVGAGVEDFGRAGARRLHRDLLRAGVKASYRDYEDIEHLAIVQVALPDVFAFFDSHR